MNFMKKLLLAVALLAVNTSYSSADNSIRSFACYALIASGVCDIISFSHLAQRMEKKEENNNNILHHHPAWATYDTNKENKKNLVFVNEKMTRDLDTLSNTAFVTLGLGVTKLYMGYKLL